VLTSVASAVCATPINAVYPQALAFGVLALVLVADAPPPGRGEWWRLPAALAAAVAAAFGNAMALVLWPLLAWMSWLQARGGQAVVVLAGGVAFGAVYVSGTPLAAEGGAAFGALERLDYLVAYLGLPWTRAAALALPGRVLGAVLLLFAVWTLGRAMLAGRHGPCPDPLATVLMAFSLTGAVAAAAARSGVDGEVFVPVRYSVLLMPLHAGALMTVAARIESAWHAGAMRVVTAAAVLLLAQQIVSGEIARAETTVMRATLAEFAAGEIRPGMETVVFDDLEQARRDFDAIRAAGLYQHAR